MEQVFTTLARVIPPPILKSVDSEQSAQESTSGQKPTRASIYINAIPVDDEQVQSVQQDESTHGEVAASLRRVGLDPSTLFPEMQRAKFERQQRQLEEAMGKIMKLEQQLQERDGESEILRNEIKRLDADVDRVNYAVHNQVGQAPAGDIQHHAYTPVPLSTTALQDPRQDSEVSTTP
jgi:CII-binding regulator of phage lambda lysogenization HflD